jgi:hypothetical protein
MCTKYQTLKVFYNILTEPCLNEGQKKAILLKLNRQQRLGIAELVINVLIGNLEIPEETRELLTNYSEQLRFIARQGKDVTNAQLARYSKAVLAVLNIAMKRLNEKDVSGSTATPEKKAKTELNSPNESAREQSSDKKTIG